MGTEKRDRQRANRARVEAARLAQEQKQKRQALILRTILLVLAVMVLGVAVNWLTRDESTDTASTSTTASTVPGAPGAIPPVAPGETITGDTPCPPTGGAEKRVGSFEKEPPMCIDANKTYTAKVTTTKGDMTFALDAKAAPKTVNSFVVLARYKFFDGIAFHRIAPGFVIQGGDPQGSGSGGPGYSFADELPASADAYQPGTLAMANSGPNSNGSQFFIMLKAGGLGPQYSVFGKVTDGYDTTVKAIEATGGGAGSDGPPTDVTTITSVVITES